MSRVDIHLLAGYASADTPARDTAKLPDLAHHGEGQGTSSEKPLKTGNFLLEI